MHKRLHVLAALMALCACTFAQAATPDPKDVASDVHVGYDYATKILANARKDCKSVRGTSRQADGSVFVDCLSHDGKDDVRWRITPHHTSVPLVELVSRKPMAKAEPNTPEAREAKVNNYATTIIRDYRYECLRVVKVTTQEDNSLIAVCTPNILKILVGQPERAGAEAFVQQAVGLLAGGVFLTTIVVDGTHRQC